MNSMFNIRQRLSVATGIQSIAGTTDTVELDEQIRSLYSSHDQLEQKCADAALAFLKTMPRKSLSTGIDGDSADVNSDPNEEKLTTSYEKSPESVVDGLPKEYFTPEYDPIGPNLEEISTWEEADMIEKFMNKIEEADTDKDVIIGHLTQMIDANYNDLMECMRNVQSIDLDLCRAGIQIGHGRQRLRSACNIIHSGAIKVKNLHTKRGKMSKMSETIRSLQALKGIHKSMMGNINTGEVGKAANHAKSVLECLKNESFDKFVALKSIGQSTERSVVTIRQKSDKALKRLCSRKFTSVDYENILTAYILLDHLCDTMDLDMYDATDKMGTDNSSSFYFDSVGCIEGLSQRINRYQLDDIDACLHTAVTEYIYSAQQKTARSATDPTHANGLGNEHVDIAEVPLNMLYRHLTADVIAPCVVRSCELLADVAHTHFMLTQWHRAPFDPQNHSSAFLHRRPLDVTAPQAASIAVLNVKTNRTSLDSHPSSHQVSGHTSVTNSPTKELMMRKSLSSNTVVENHSEIIDLGREFHDEESDGEDAGDDEDDVVADGYDAISALANTYRKMTQVTSTLSEELTNSIMSSFAEHFPHILHQDMDKTHLPHVMLSDDVSAADVLNTSNPDSGLKLAMAFDGLQQSRAILWEEMLRALVSMLNMMTFTSEVKIEDFLAMAWALNNMVELGREFCGSESQVLIGILQDKSKEYFHNFHCESFQLIRDMLEAESWQSVPIDLAASGGILGIIKTTLVRDAARSGKIYFNSSSAASIKAQSGSIESPVRGEESSTGEGAEGDGDGSSTTTPDTNTNTVEAEVVATPTILMRFGAEGNPFHFMTNPAAAAAAAATPVERSGASTPANNSIKSAAGSVTSVTFSSSTKNEGVATTAATTRDDEGEISIERKELRSFWKVLQDTSGEPAVKSKRAAEQSAYTVVTQTALNGVAKFVAKYLHLMYLLPASAKGIFDNLSQLFDYYLCAVFNGFMPFDERQKFLAPQTKLNSPPPNGKMEFELLQEYLERALDMLVETATTDAAYDHNDDESSATSATHNNNNINNMGFSAHGASVHSLHGSQSALDSSDHSGGRISESSPMNNSSMSSANNTNATNPSSAPAPPPMSPMGTVMVEGTKMSALLRPPGIPLNIESTCMALNERIVAAESCCFIAVILQELKNKIMKLVPEEHAPAVEQFVSQYQRVAGQLRALIYRASCPQLIKHNQILSQITDCAWDSKKMRTEVHEWVPKLADNCRAVWDYMMLTEQFAESSPLLREQVWLEICQAAFDVCLEGYAKVRKCSVEGRSAMTTDTMALHDALNTIHLCRPPRGKHYIDNFLRSALLSEEELLTWVRDNWESYAYRHVHGLLTQVLFSMLNSKKLKDATALMDSLYELKDSENTSTLSSLMAQTDGTFSRFSSQFRRQTMGMSMGSMMSSSNG